MEKNPLPISIRNENDLFRVIESLHRGQRRLPDGILFDDWPRFEVTIRGENFDGGIPTRIMPSLLKAQKTIDRVHAKAIGKKRLPRNKRPSAELIVRPKSGSTTLISELAPVLNQILVAGNAASSQILYAALTLAFASGALAFKAYLNHRVERIKYEQKKLTHDVELARIEAQVSLSEQETRRQELLLNFISNNPLAKSSLHDVDTARDLMLKSLANDDELSTGAVQVKGSVARRIIRRPSSNRVQDRLDGNFVILSVESGKIDNGFRIRVQDVNTEKNIELTVMIPDGTLPRDQIEVLKNGEWNKDPLHMKINVVRIGKRISEATLVSAGLRSTDQFS